MDETGKTGQIYVMGDRGWNVSGTGDYNDDDNCRYSFKQDNGNHNIWLMDETGKIGQIYM